MGGVRKSVKSELLTKNKVEFSEHKVGEEAIYSFLLMHYAKSFSFIKGSVYDYVNHAGSQSDTLDNDPWGGVAIALKEKVMQMGLYDKYADTINAFIATATIVSLDKMTRNYTGTEYQRRAKERVRRFQTEIDRNYPVDLGHMSVKAKILYPFVVSGCIVPIYVASRINRARRNKCTSLSMMNRKGTNEHRAKN